MYSLLRYAFESCICNFLRLRASIQSVDTEEMGMNPLHLRRLFNQIIKAEKMKYGVEIHAGNKTQHGRDGWRNHPLKTRRANMFIR